MTEAKNRRDAQSLKDVDPQVLAKLSRGEIETQSLVESLAVNFSMLMQSSFPAVGKRQIELLASMQDKGITQRMGAAAKTLVDYGGSKILMEVMGHPSDTVRGWAAYMIGIMPHLSLAERLALIKPLASDRHFVVREWAWLGVRPKIATEIKWALQILQDWGEDKQPYIRRFASEATRPRGVWSEHIPELKHNPEIAAKLLDVYKIEEDKYVQDSVANWLNDAAKSRPEWVSGLCHKWRESYPGNPHTERICVRALRLTGPGMAEKN